MCSNCETGNIELLTVFFISDLDHSQEGFGLTVTFLSAGVVMLKEKRRSEGLIFLISARIICLSRCVSKVWR